MVTPLYLSWSFHVISDVWTQTPTLLQKALCLNQTLYDNLLPLRLGELKHMQLGNTASAAQLRWKYTPKMNTRKKPNACLASPRERMAASAHVLGNAYRSKQHLSSKDELRFLVSIIQKQESRACPFPTTPFLPLPTGRRVAELCSSEDPARDARRCVGTFYSCAYRSHLGPLVSSTVLWKWLGKQLRK